MSLLAHEQTANPSNSADADSGPNALDRADALSSALARASVADLFSRGNYATVARYGPGDDWRTYAALGLIGRTEEAIEGLGRFTDDEAAFYAAVARWIGGKEDDHIPRLLEPLQHRHAQNLLALVRKPRIEILTQWPSVRSGCADLLSGARHDQRFAVRNISFHPDDLPNRPYADIHHYYDWQRPPDFYACAMVEWHLIPPNLPELPCPILGQTGDYDLHVQAVHPWLQLFDELLVTDGSEWTDVTRLAPVTVSTFPKSFVLPDGIPPFPVTSRDVDVFLSGSVFHPYHLDKGELLGQLLAIPEIRVHLVNGFKAPEEYYRHLANSKLSIAYVRHPQALPTRGLESLAMGCATLVQRGSVLTLFAGKEEGVLEYDLASEDLSQRIHDVVQHWPEFEKRARRGASRIREQFTGSRVASQYLRFLTFLAARPRSPRAVHRMPRLQKRMVLEKGWLPSNDLVGSRLLKELAIRNHEKLQPALERDSTSPHPLIDAAREAVLANYHRVRAGKVPAEEWLRGIRRLYAKAQELFPRALVPRFNHIRVALHFGTPAAVGEALALLDETLGFPEDRWQADVMEDVFPWDFFPHFFNYRNYFDLIIADLTRGADAGRRLCRLILASLHSYRGHFPTHNGFYSRGLDDFRRAMELDPSFPYYKLWYSSHLIERGLTEDYAEAEAHLKRLVKGSVPLLEADELLKQVKGERAGGGLHLGRTQFDVIEKLVNMPVPGCRKLREASPPGPTSNRLDSPISMLPTGLPAQLHAKQREVDDLKNIIHAMERSRFWLARKAWVRLKQLVRGKG
jgi:tetratricopeptide (TPR) repeat protein